MNKTATINIQIKVDFKDEYDLWQLEELKKFLNKPVYLYGKDYTGFLRLADRNPNQYCLWNDLLYLPDVTQLKVTKIEEDKDADH